VEDCQWHKLRVVWDPSSHWLRTYFDGVLRVEKQIDLVAVIFNNDPNVYWGFTGATGGSVNLQQFCTALDPIFTNNLTANMGCAGTQVQFTNQSESFAPIASYHWDFGDGTSSNLSNPPVHSYSTPGIYPVKLKITGLDGCERDTTQLITIGSVPDAAFTIASVCNGRLPSMVLPVTQFGVTYSWKLDGVIVSTNRIPVLPVLSNGTHQLQLTVHSMAGCGADATVQQTFTVAPSPVILLTRRPNACGLTCREYK
jgi:hypothetical protein